MKRRDLAVLIMALAVAGGFFGVLGFWGEGGGAMDPSNGPVRTFYDSSYASGISVDPLPDQTAAMRFRERPPRRRLPGERPSRVASPPLQTAGIYEFEGPPGLGPAMVVASALLRAGELNYDRGLPPRRG